MRQRQRPKIAVQIRQARRGDRREILECLASAFEPYREQYTAAAYADTVLEDSSLKARMQTMQVIVAVLSAKVIGTVAGAQSDTGEGHLRGMAVVPQYQGRGISAQLLAAIEAWLRARGSTRVTLDTTLPLLAAMKFYEKHGYSRSGRMSDFFGMPLIDYVKQLD